MRTVSFCFAANLFSKIALEILETVADKIEIERHRRQVETDLFVYYVSLVSDT